jgi:hypothetical protein
VTGFLQSPHHVAAHSAKSDHSKLHRWSPFARDSVFGYSCRGMFQRHPELATTPLI